MIRSEVCGFCGSNTVPPDNLCPEGTSVWPGVEVSYRQMKELLNIRSPIENTLTN